MKKTILTLFLAIVFLSPALTFAQESQPSSAEAVFNFLVTSKAGTPRQGDLLMLKSKKTGKVYSSRTGADGKCTVNIPSADKYVIFYKLFADTIKYNEIDVPGADHRVIYTFTVKYNMPRSYTVKNVFFETGLSTLKKESYPALNELVDAMKSKPSLAIEIAGHTDNVGSPESNMKLSDDRANAVRDYLLKQGIAPGRVTAKGYGETMPVAGNETPEGRQQNRRTEVRIVSE